MNIPPQILHTLQSFAILFAEISLLFIGIDMLVGYINKRYSNAVQRHLSTNSYVSYFKAILLGAITPFCSCSTIPFFQSLVRNGVHLSVSFAYLLTSPLINPILITMLFMTFGFALGLSYMCFVVIAVFFLALSLKNADAKLLLKEGFLMDSVAKSSCCAKSQNHNTFNSFTTKSCCVQANAAQDKHIKFNPQSIAQPNAKSCCSQTQNKDSQVKSSFQSLFTSSFKNYKKILPFLAVGMAIGAFIHDFIPQESLQEILKDFNYFGVILAAIIGIFLYIRVEAIIPIGLGLINAGVPLGIVMSLLIAGGGCSLPELIVLKSMFKMRLLYIFVAMVLAISIGFGFLVVLLGL